MRRVLIAGMLLVASLAIAGAAGANGCTSGETPLTGFYKVCLLAEAGSSFSSATYSYDRGSNVPASVATDAPNVGWANASGAQYHNTSTSITCGFGTCYTTTFSDDATRLLVFYGPGAPLVGVQQEESGASTTANTGYYSNSHTQTTSVGASHNLGSDVRVSVSQTRTESHSTYGNSMTCATNVNTPAAQQSAPCIVDTPAGPVDTTIPQLYGVCAATPSPAPPATACPFRLPHWPSLPFP